MKRVLQVIGGLNRAGAETMLMNLYRIMDKKEIQFDFLIYTQEKQDYEDEIIKLGGRILRISVHGATRYLQYIYKIRAIIKEFGPYIAIHIHTLNNGAFALLAATPFKKMIKVMHSHNTYNDNKSCMVSIYNAITKQIIRYKADVCIACGRDAGFYLFGESFKKEGIILNNGIMVSDYLRDYSKETERIKKECNITEQDLVIGCIGRLETVKNHVFAIQIANYLKNKNVSFKMLIIGSGSQRDLLESRIKQYNLSSHVKLLGVRSDIPTCLKVMDVFLMPSFFEGLPVSLIEAQASGVPCIVSDNITLEADIGLNLIHFINLDQSVESWGKLILDMKGKKFENKEKIVQAIKEKGYDSQDNIDKLIKIYEGNLCINRQNGHNSIR